MSAITGPSRPGCSGTVGGPRRLTPAERRRYEEEGFVVVPGVFPPEDLEVVDREIDRLLGERGQLASDHLPGWVFQVGLRSEVTRQFAQDERLLALVEDIVKPGIAIHEAKLVTKLPHSDEICHWHQDDAYFVRLGESQTRMSVWVPLQEAHAQNGCLWVVPGSHRWGLKDHEQVTYGTCRRRLTPEELAAKEAIPVPVRAGSVVLFSALTWHSSQGNVTDRIRRAFIVTYQEATVPRGNGAEWKVLRPADASLPAG